MKTYLQRGIFAYALISIFNIQLSAAHAQGSLTPPSAPAPTMKTLSQIEPRTPISSAPFTITKPGSYYLTTNIMAVCTDGIDIDANGVTLDLNGFTISTDCDVGVGIYLQLSSGNSDITIVNGHIVGAVTPNYGNGQFSGNGFQYGINCSGTPRNVRVSGVSVSGCLLDGINLNIGNGTVVESCTVNTVGGNGIVADSVFRCAALLCGGEGIDATTASVSRGFSIGGGTGLFALTADNCYGYSDYSYLTGGGANGPTCTGLSATIANNCYGFSFAGGGSSIGLSAINANNCYGYCSGAGTPTGLSASVAIGCYGSGDYTGSIIFLPPHNSINATIANSCIAGDGGESITDKYNMP